MTAVIGENITEEFMATAEKEKKTKVGFGTPANGVFKCIIFAITISGGACYSLV